MRRGAPKAKTEAGARGTVLAVLPAVPTRPDPQMMEGPEDIFMRVSFTRPS